MLNRLKKLIPSKRKIMQLYFALLFNANFKGFVTGSIYKGNTKVICAPGINCYSCPGAVGACPLGSLEGSFSADRSTLFYMVGILLLYSLLFGRMICGWLCPFGLIQELIHKIPSPKLKKSPVTRLLSWLKYVILVFFVFIVPIMYAFRGSPLPAFCKYICPAGTLEGGLGLLSNKINESYLSMLGPLFTWKFLLMVSILVGCVFVFRLFCRFLCPLGALYGLFNKLSVFGVKVSEEKCVDCGKCVSQCHMDIRHVGDTECISCGECIDVCPTKAIQWKGNLAILQPNETDNEKERVKKAKLRTITRTITAVVMAAVLIGAAVFFWNDTTGQINAVQGSNVGDLCFSRDLQMVDGTGLLGGTVDPTKTGKLTIVNFWGTWCPGCVAELPYFDRIAADYEGEVEVIAIHTSMLIDTADEFIAEKYPDSKIVFASDYVEEGSNAEMYYTNLGGRGSYPYTVILDENGVILEQIVSTVTYEDLRQAIENAK